MRSLLRLAALCAVMLLTHFAKAQSFIQDFENPDGWLAPWIGVHIVPDGDSLSGNHICLCDSIYEYGFGFSINAGTEFPRQNIRCRFEFDFSSPDSLLNALVVFNIDGGDKPYWSSYPLTNFKPDSTGWARARFSLNFPMDYIGEGRILGYIWNRENEILFFDNAELEIEAWRSPSYQPEIEHKTDSTFLEFGLLSPYLMMFPSYLIPVVEYIDAHGDTLSDPSVVEIKFDDGWIEYYGHPHSSIIANFVDIEATFKEEVKLLRLAFVLPLPEGKLTIYRRNQHIDTTDYQRSYYLDREGFSFRNDSLKFSIYHNTGISSLQLDMEERMACFNIDYWRDHPLLHYPMRTDTTDCFEDISYREIKAGETLKGQITIYNSAPEELPRLMPVWDGYQSAFIFTEHADWTDLRTHRAVLFGNENITSPTDAVGGFCYFNIPVTKSVFYWNPDKVTNEMTSKGRFPGLHATIQTDKEFYKLLKTIKKQGFEICLHSPEQYTTVPSEFPKAMRFMKRQFNTVSWIDHGYNNGPDKNREDMVCDGLLPDSPQYAAALWKANGVRYLWNAYYEENRLEDQLFDGHFVQPYEGFGDALPNRQITTLPNGDKDFLLWSTPSTLEVNENHEWYYYFDSVRLQRLVDQHNVFITHIYPAWTDPWRAFWQYNENGTAVAMPGFNFALSQLARFRDEKKILPTTVEEYLTFYEKLLNVDYQILDNNSILLANHGKTIKGLTLLCNKPIIVEGKAIDFRKVDEGYLVWFNLNKNETVIIRYRE
jgi:hypothetical protein